MRREKLVIILVFLGIVSVISAQGYSLSISPGSGSPGIVVTLSPNPTYSDERCFANGAPTGRSYTVPAGASGTITFYCEAGAGEFYVRTNDAAFTVIQSDGDSDGIPDGQDQCPNLPAPNTQNGCPPDEPAPDNPNQPPPGPQTPPDNPNQSVTDSDGDGIPDTQDECPNNIGTIDRNGCPEQITLPELPENGGCMLATSGNFRANIRLLYDEFSPRIGSINSDEIYPVIGQTQYSDGTWYLIDPGWVSGDVVRTGGDCEDMVVLGIDPFDPIPMDPDLPRVPPIDFCDLVPSLIIFEGTYSARDASSILDDMENPTPDLIVDGRFYIGTSCPEIIIGDNAANIIDGRGGNDLIFGVGGNDILVGGSGNDRIAGMDGNDVIIGGAGDDHLLGESGDDRISGNEGDDILSGGDDDDKLYGNDGNDTVGDYSGTNRLYGMNGDDRMEYSNATNYVYGGAGNDRMSNWDSRLGRDSISFVYGGSGNDEIRVHVHGVDFVHGQTGYDTITLTYSLPAYYRWRGIDITEVYAGPQDDTITTPTLMSDDSGRVLTAYVLYGEDGNDTISGAGDLVGGPGNDTLTLYSDERLGSQFAFGNDGNDTITGVGTGTFHLYGGNGDDTIYGGEGRDIILGEAGNDRLNGNEGYDYIDGGDDDDQLYGTNSDRFLIRSDLNNYLVGNAGDDTLDGGWSTIDVCIEDGDDTTVVNCESTDSGLRSRWQADIDDIDTTRY